MSKSLYKKKKYIDQDVFTKALERMRYCYETWDKVVISFSGGKDSTAVLQCALIVAEEMRRLPVDVIFYDEEAIHPPTIEYVQRVYDDPKVNLEWYCLEIQHRNACSNAEPFWYCWDSDKKDLWIRDMPEQGITSHPMFKKGMSMQVFGSMHFHGQNACILQGIRTEESLRRYRAVARKTHENYITKASGTPEYGAPKGVTFAYPIYDWSSQDVWTLVAKLGCDYNRTYDIFNRTDNFGQYLKQRVCPPYGEEPLRGLHFYAECFPEMWHKMVKRVPGAATAARYGNTQLYSSGYKPDQTDWRQHIENILITFSPKDRKKVEAQLNGLIKTHNSKTADKIPMDQPHPLTGISWAFLTRVATRGDFKGRIAQNAANEAAKAQQKLGITREQAEEIYGR